MLKEFYENVLFSTEVLCLYNEKKYEIIEKKILTLPIKENVLCHSSRFLL